MVSEGSPKALEVGLSHWKGAGLRGLKAPPPWPPAKYIHDIVGQAYDTNMWEMEAESQVEAM